MRNQKQNKEDFVPEIELMVLSDIVPSPMNPRKTFSEDALKELSDNIREQGLLQPITVRPMVDDVIDGVCLTRPAGDRVPSHYEIVCGERRYRACKKLGMFEMPVIVRDLSDDEAFDAMVTENLQRQDVDPIEEAVAFKLLTTRGTSADELAARFGKSVRYIYDRIRLAQLNETLRMAVSAGRITLRGGYLLARLNEADQQAFIDEEYDEDEEYTTANIEEWLDRHFMNLLRAPFQDGETLNERWNVDGKLIRRCQTCDCNTCNHGCLFADMQTDEPQCIDEVCYDRKTDIYYDWILRQYESRLVLAGKPATAGSVALFNNTNCYYGNEYRKRINSIIDKFKSAGYRVFTEKELPSQVWSNKEGELADGTAIECIEISQMAYRKRIEPYVRRIHNAEPSRPATTPDGSPSGPTNYPARLAERSATIEKTADKKVVNYTKKNFDRDKYVAVTHSLEDWELITLFAIAYDKIPWDRKKALIPGTEYSTATFKQIQKLAGDKIHDDVRVKREAIAAFITSSYKESFLEEAMKHLSIEANDFITKTRKKANDSINEITEELRELGYDEKGNRIVHGLDD